MQFGGIFIIQSLELQLNDLEKVIYRIAEIGSFRSMCLHIQI